MKLTLEQIRSITTGAVTVEQAEDGFHFYRFTPEQMNLCQPHVRLYDQKLLVTAGVRFSFRTDSTTLYLRAALSPGTARSYFSFDLTINGVHTDSLENVSHLPFPKDDPTYPCPLGLHEKTFDLGPGAKDICLYFPWSVIPVLEELSVDEGTCVTPLFPPKKLLVYGDSISQGYDGFHPCDHYVSRLARALDAQVLNKAIGGSTSFPEMARAKDAFDPDYILVAYGTNDWSLFDETSFVRQYRAMHQAIQDNYPYAQVFALTPIWRADFDQPRKFGLFSTVDALIHSIAADFPNVTAISGFDFVPKDPDFFADRRLHPNDAGFDHYFKNLWPQIKAVLKE